MKGFKDAELVLAISPCTRGLAFVVFEGPLSPIDWGVRDIRGAKRNETALEATKDLIKQHQPDVLVLHAYPGTSTKRLGRVHRLSRLMAAYAAAEAVECNRFSRQDIRACFRDAGAVTRYEIAQVIAAHVPALNHRLPPMKKLWQSEDRRMRLFDAASLVMTYYAFGSCTQP